MVEVMARCVHYGYRSLLYWWRSVFACWPFAVCGLAWETMAESHSRWLRCRYRRRGMCVLPRSDCGFLRADGKQVEGVQSAQCKLMQKEVGITILMTLLAGVESNLVDLAATVQGRIKQMLEASCGITDATVEVLFEKKA